MESPNLNFIYLPGDIQLAKHCFLNKMYFKLRIHVGRISLFHQQAGNVRLKLSSGFANLLRTKKVDNISPTFSGTSS